MNGPIFTLRVGELVPCTWWKQKSITECPCNTFYGDWLGQNQLHFGGGELIGWNELEGNYLS